MRPLLSRLLLATTLGVTASAAADDAPGIPHVGARAQASYQEYRYADEHRAFAIAPGGAWAWQAGQPSADAARTAAVDACQRHTAQHCVAYAVDGDVVFDAGAWSRLWRPYGDARSAQLAPSGVGRGERMPDLAFRTAAGRPQSLAGLRGRIVLLHFWGSWCPPCMRELPLLQRFHDVTAKEFGTEVAMVLLQVREPFTVAASWLERNDLASLPLYDSGASGPADDALRVTGGEPIPDRTVAARFPTSYVLDRHGVVLFRHVGPIDDWTEYLPFFRDAVAADAD